MKRTAAEEISGEAAARGSGRPKGADAHARREDIVEAAQQLFSMQGYQGTSMSAIARASGLSQTGLLHYFGTKAEVLQEVMDRRDAEDINAITGWAHNEIRGWARLELLVTLTEMNVRRSGMVRLFTAMSGEAILDSHPAQSWLLKHHELAFSRLELAFRQAKEDGELAPGSPIEALARMLVAAMDGLQIQWLSNAKMTDEQLVRDVAELVETVKLAWKI